MTIYGIRHHGPGCARSLLDALNKSAHDLILLESPLESEHLFPQLAADGMKPPVAMLLYQTDEAETASFYPFAHFSPEWQTLLWAQKNNVPIQAFDLPAAHSFALKKNAEEEKQPEEETSSPGEEDEELDTDGVELSEEFYPHEDPFNWFAKADGYTDGEQWWNDKVEERSSSSDFFTAILEAVTALRNELDLPESPRTLIREAWMRRCIRKAEKDGYKDIAIVCGAWHAPALATKHSVSADNALLKGLPKVKVSATWTPWTHSRLTLQSGYGAGVRAPGWYDHLWKKQEHANARWITKAARILRKHDLEGSSASIIEATRLSESLAGLRGRPRPGLDESLEAIRTVFCAGEEFPLQLLEAPLLIGQQLGKLPDELCELPLQKDIESSQKRLRLKPTSAVKEVTFDLREERGREKSAFLHRLRILKIDWGETLQSHSKGTFKEIWKLFWQPEMVLSIIDAAPHGNTVEVAASNALAKIPSESTLTDIAKALDLSLLAALPQATARILRILNNSAASSSDTRELLSSIPTLVTIARYGDVRKTDSAQVVHILSQLTTRAHLDLISTASNLDEEASADFTQILREYAASLRTLGDDTILQEFFQTARKLAEANLANPQPRGLAVRLLRDSQEIDSDKCTTLLSHALSPGQEPGDAASWLEGFLAGSGALLIHDRPLLALIHQWLSQLPDDLFQETLPLLRRTFGSFTSPERSQISQVISTTDLTSTASQSKNTEPAWDLADDRAEPVIAKACELLTLPRP